MAKFPKMPLWTDAYLGDTTHLTTLEHGAFLLLLIAMWRTDGVRLPDDDTVLAKRARLTPAQWRRIRPTIAALCTVEGGYWYSGRLRREYEAVKQYRKSQSNNAQARWLKENDSDDAEAEIRHDVGNAPNPNPKVSNINPLTPLNSGQGAPLCGAASRHVEPSETKDIKHAGIALTGNEQCNIKGDGLTAIEHPGKACGGDGAKKLHYLHDEFPGILNADQFAKNLPDVYKQIMRRYLPADEDQHWHDITAISFWDHWVGSAPRMKTGKKFKKQNWLWAFEHSCKVGAEKRRKIVLRRMGAGHR